MNKKYVFISYSLQDRSFVEKLVHDLRSAGIETWNDINQISAGENWQKAVVRGMKQASAMLFILSKHSIESNRMAFELGVCHHINGITIPVIIDDEGKDNNYTSGNQMVDFRGDYDTGLESLKKCLIEIVGSGPPLSSEKHKIKGYVFLSYAEEDTVFLGELRKFLGNHGYAYWDYAESDRDYHAQFFLELESVIRDATATLSILSPSWKQSQWTIKEYLFSEEINTPVFLLKANEIGPTLAIAGMPYIDFIKNREIGFDKLAKELRRKGL